MEECRLRILEQLKSIPGATWNGNTKTLTLTQAGAVMPVGTFTLGTDGKPCSHNCQHLHELRGRNELYIVVVAEYARKRNKPAPWWRVPLVRVQWGEFNTDMNLLKSTNKSCKGTHLLSLFRLLHSLTGAECRLEKFSDPSIEASPDMSHLVATIYDGTDEVGDRETPSPTPSPTLGQTDCTPMSHGKKSTGGVIFYGWSFF